MLGIITDLEAAIRTDDLENINLLLQQLGKTGFINREKPTPFDEAISLIWYLENVFYHSMPDIIIRLLEGLGQPLHTWENPSILKVGFWPGGDRDGNPFVTHETTIQVADRLKKWLMRCYYRDLRKLRKRLTFKHVEEHIVQAERGIYYALFENKEVYSTKEDLLAVLFEAREALIKYHDGLFLDLLDRFILKVRIFGFHFAYMDLRQDSRKHDGLWEEVFTIQGRKFTGTEDELIQAVLNTQSLPDLDQFKEPFHKEMLLSTATVKSVQKTNGEDGLHRYIISNCQSVLHIIEVYQMAKLTLGVEVGKLPLDIVPLFETIDDLKMAPQIMTKLYQMPEYKTHLTSRGHKQNIMLGFSDGTKDGGI